MPAAWGCSPARPQRTGTAACSPPCAPGTAFIAVVIGADDPAARTAAASALLDYGFASYRVETLLRAGDAVVEDAPVQDGAARTVDLVVRGDVSLLLPRADAAPQAAAEAPQPLCAPAVGGYGGGDRPLF